MISSASLAWLQLTREKARLLVALAGVAFAVVLVFMQLGFHDALFTSAVAVHERLDADIFLINPQSHYLATMKTFPRRRLYQALGFDGVESVTPIYARLAPWKHPDTGRSREIFVVGIDPAGDAFDVPAVAARRERIRLPDAVLFDEASRPEFGPVAARVRAGDPVSTEVSGHRVTVDGLFRLGISFGIDGMLITSDLNFLRLFPAWPPGLINIGLVKLRPGTDAEAVRDALAASLPRDVTVLTRQEYVQREKHYWATSTPIGYVFTFGVLMGWFVGAIIVYQILFADVATHLREYATLKAIGYRNGYLLSVVLIEALFLAVVGYVPGLAFCAELYRLAASATRLPMEIAPGRSLQVLASTIAMCGVSGALAVRKIRSADPAEVF